MRLSRSGLHIVNQTTIPGITMPTFYKISVTEHGDKSEITLMITRSAYVPCGQKEFAIFCNKEKI